jgi:metal transporter CNNM
MEPEKAEPVICSRKSIMYALCMTVLTWIGIFLCLAQAGMFSGLNLAFFSISKLRLEVEASQGNKKAVLISRMRKDSNLLLATILWANVAVNVLLTLLSNSVLVGVAAFLFSTVALTLFGEIIPQAFFSRYAMSAAYYLSPIVRVYRVLLFVVAKPTALLLNALLGHESVKYFKEAGLREVIRMHMRADAPDIAEVEGTGALNFLALDDLSVLEEGERIDPDSIIELPFEDGRPQFPSITGKTDDQFLKHLVKSRKKWTVVVDSHQEPMAVIDTDSFISDALFSHESFSPLHHCHRPITITDPATLLGSVLIKLKVHPQHLEDDVIDEDIVIVWTPDEHRIITGSDILGRLLRGIVSQEHSRFQKIAVGRDAPV